MGLYDELCCSVRYAASAGICGFLHPADALLAEEQQTGCHVVSVTTASGTIQTVYREIREDGRLVNRRVEQYPVSTPEHLRVVTDLVERTQYRADEEQFTDAASRMGHRGEPTIFLNSSGFTELIKEHCGLARTFYLLTDHPSAVEEYLEACDRRDSRQIDAALQLPCRIFNLGDHATNEFTPPAILKRYMLPRWQWISERLHRAGRFVHSHWDGNAKAILPYLAETGLDSVEALTPKPQGDITLEEIKAAVGESIVCLDLLLAIAFLPNYPLADLLDFARRAIDTFAPHLILGVSDEISQIGEIERVETISELVDDICGLAS